MMTCVRFCSHVMFINLRGGYLEGSLTSEQHELNYQEF